MPKDDGNGTEIETEVETSDVKTHIPDKFRSTETMKVTGSLEELAPDLLRFGRGRYRTVTLTVRNPDHTFELPSHEMHEVVIGRADDALDFIPTIDLTNFGAKLFGVSRRHATLTNKNGLLFITDHSTKNGTFVNDIRIDPEIPHVITHGDIVQLGRVQLWIRFTDKVLST
ncbi:MAG: FHA domain-containing protein [Chloroflexota bacterium]